jgi:exodeoxyribonuclease VII large subunit
MAATAYDYLQYPNDEPPLQVHQYIAFCNNLLGQTSVRVEGEVANYSVSQGKFVFFDLKDEKEDAMIGVFLMLHTLSTPLEDGMRVYVSGKSSIYSKRGSFRLNASRVEAVGEGSVKRAFELLKDKLAKEGLFRDERKRPLPPYPQRVGIISSEDAAGFGDFCRIAWQRLPGVEYIFANVAVQGVSAEREIIAALDVLNEHPLDVIVLIRGGGSMEDLHAFNSELVARAIVRSRVPVLVGVGHERDITIADYCADCRAATPSNAAQILLPTKEEVRDRIVRLTASGQRRIAREIDRLRHTVDTSTSHQFRMIESALKEIRSKTEYLIRTIEAISPSQTLARGYSIALTSHGEVIRTPDQVKPGDAMRTVTAKGEIVSNVK